MELKHIQIHKRTQKIHLFYFYITGRAHQAHLTFQKEQDSCSDEVSIQTLSASPGPPLILWTMMTEQPRNTTHKIVVFTKQPHGRISQGESQMYYGSELKPKVYFGYPGSTRVRAMM